MKKTDAELRELEIRKEGRIEMERAVAEKKFRALVLGALVLRHLPCTGVGARGALSRCGLVDGLVGLAVP